MEVVEVVVQPTMAESLVAMGEQHLAQEELLLVSIAMPVVMAVARLAAMVGVVEVVARAISAAQAEMGEQPAVPAARAAPVIRLARQPTSAILQAVAEPVDLGLMAQMDQ